MMTLSLAARRPAGGWQGVSDRGDGFGKGNASPGLRISPVCLLAGRLPPRVLALIVEWASLE